MTDYLSKIRSILKELLVSSKETAAKEDEAINRAIDSINDAVACLFAAAAEDLKKILK